MSKTYLVHGKRGDGPVEAKVFEARSGAEARAMGEAIGLSVVAIEVREDPGDSDAFSRAAPDDPRKLPEEDVWTRTPSQWVNFWWWALCVLLLPIPWAVWKWLSVRANRFTLTTQRMRVESGVLQQHVNEVELYRVKDTELTRSFVQRALGLGTVTVVSSDESVPRLVLPCVHEPQLVREQIRDHVEKVRKARGVRELDVS